MTHCKISMFILFAALVFSYPSVPAKSWRVIEGLKYLSNRSSGTDATVSEKLNTKSTVAVEETDKIYDIVFVTNYKGPIFTVGEAAADRARSSRFQNFKEQLNTFGGLGYKLSFAIGGLPYAIVKSDESQYEYDWFETSSSLFFVKSGLSEKLAEMNARGFRLIEHDFISQSCELIDNENPEYGDNCIYKDYFLFEKEKGGKRQVEQVIVNSFPGWGVKPSAEMTAEIDEKLAEGFYPVRAISKFEILMEKLKEKDDLVNDNPDVQVVRSGMFGGGIEKKVEELAKQGYRLAMTHKDIAVLYRNEVTAKVPVSYIWLRADKKDFEKQLTKLQQKGVRYCTTYPNEKGNKNTLIFERNLDGKGEKGEFKILSFEFDSVENKTEGKVYISLTSSSKEAVKKMNELAKQGFVVKDLFNSGKVSLILQRTK